MDAFPEILKKANKEPESESYNTEECSNFEPIIPDNNADYYQFRIETNKQGWFHKLSNNLKFNFKSGINKSIEEHFVDSEDPVILLGEIFETKIDKKTSFFRFKKKFHNLIWVSYRNDFRPLINTKKNKSYTSDVGWGCTIRVGQMLLLNTLKIHFNLTPSYYCELLKTIEENLIAAPYSIHNIIQLGGQTKLAGEWFSPIEICNSLKKVLKISPCKNFKMIICMDSMIFKDEIYAEACDLDIEYTKTICKCINCEDICSYCNLPKMKLEWKNAALLIMPLMLGRKKIDRKYFELLKFALRIKYSVGIIGEKSNSAMFIVGYHENDVIVLDPHHVKKACSSFEDFKGRIQEYFSHDLLTIDIRDLGSSICIGFYIKNSAEFNDFQEILKRNREIIEDIIIIKDKSVKYSFDDSCNDAGNDDHDEFFIL